MFSLSASMPPKLDNYKHSSLVNRDVTSRKESTLRQ